MHPPLLCLPARRSHNGIEQLEGLGSLANLKILDIANNRIRRLEGLEVLQVGCCAVLCGAGQGKPGWGKRSAAVSCRVGGASATRL